MEQAVVVITDVTRMKAGRVCVAGYGYELEEAGKFECIRPIIQAGITEDWLYLNEEPLIRPFSMVILNLLYPRSQPPHTEDWIIDPNFKREGSYVRDSQKIDFLESCTSQGVDRIFGAKLHSNQNISSPLLGCYVQLGEGRCSLGTIRCASVDFVKIQATNDKVTYRLTFRDMLGVSYDLPVVDLSFRYYVDHLLKKMNWSCGRIGLHLYNHFARCDAVFLRIGVARGWNQDPQQPQNCCYLQVTGIYTFPDYLEGRSFADFSISKTQIFKT